MTVRDVCNDFGYKPPTATSVEVCSASIVGAGGTYIAPNSYDATSGGGAYLTELTALDTILSVGGINYFCESGAGFGMRLVVDWVTAPVGTGTIDAQLITSARPELTFDQYGNPLSFTAMLDFGALPVSQFFAGYRQIAMLPRSSNWQRYLGLQIITTGTMTAGSYIAWLALDLDSEVLGYESSFTIK